MALPSLTANAETILRVRVVTFGRVFCLEQIIVSSMLINYVHLYYIIGHIERALNRTGIRYKTQACYIPFGADSTQQLLPVHTHIAPGFGSSLFVSLTKTFKVTIGEQGNLSYLDTQAECWFRVLR